jgi:hypothetical protein
MLLCCRLEHLERVSARDASAILVLHPDDSSSSSSDGDDGDDDGGSASSVGAGADSSPSAGGAALKMQTIMALTAQMEGKKAAVVVQVRGVQGFRV